MFTSNHDAYFEALSEELEYMTDAQFVLVLTGIAEVGVLWNQLTPIEKQVIVRNSLVAAMAAANQ